MVQMVSCRRLRHQELLFKPPFLFGGRETYPLVRAYLVCPNVVTQLWRCGVLTTYLSLLRGLRVIQMLLRSLFGVEVVSKGGYDTEEKYTNICS